ncbi:DUF4271 domain-containing protein [Algoriphagus pacificus]|uniref:DUF4271 domain-containing protein n=1 Tax=Algoriphagus pacificus TaxID=2811234 RepID=A0ABS3CD03_9BACT|nr:DUF4271 domain-containing protein [Algoriphagus pacificus]MBN7814051.1 DUF4271 domain-containing protein [Algoriphagus pacificus]
MKHPLFKIFVFFIAVNSFCLFAKAQVLQDFNSSWEKGMDESLIRPNDRLVLPLDLQTFPLANISFEFPGKSVVFIGEKLWIYAENDTSFARNIQDLSKEFGEDQVTLTVFKKGISVGDASVLKVLSSDFDKPTKSAEVKDFVSQNRRFNRQDLRDFFFVGVLIVLVILAIYKVIYPYLFASMIRPESLLTAEDFSDSGSLQKFFSVDVLFYILMVNLMTSLVAVIGLVFNRQEWLETWIGVDFNSLMLLWLFGAVGLLLLTMIKFIGIRVIAYLFDLGKLEFAHFFYLLRLVVITIAGLVLVIAFFLVNDFSSAKSAIGVSLSVFFWVYIAGVLGLFLIMMNRLSFKKYHLFTYLCIAELVPFLIMAKWIMVLGQ